MTFLKNMLAGGAGIAAAHNAHLAELTLPTLTAAQKDQILESLVPVMRLGAPHFSDDEHKQLFRDAKRIEQLNFLAMTMLYCGVPTAIAGEHWQIVKNPLATMVDDQDIAANAGRFRRTYGIEVVIGSDSFDPLEWYFGSSDAAPASNRTTRVVQEADFGSESTKREDLAAWIRRHPKPKPAYEQTWRNNVMKWMLGLTEGVEPSSAELRADKIKLMLVSDDYPVGGGLGNLRPRIREAIHNWHRLSKKYLDIDIS